MCEAAASCKDIAQASVTNWEPHGVTLAGYYALRRWMKVQLVTLYCVSHLQRYEVTLRGNITSVCSAHNSISCHSVHRYEVMLSGNVTSVYPPLKAYGWVDHAFLTLPLDRRGWSPLCPKSFQYLLNRKLNELEGRSGSYRNDKNLLLLCVQTVIHCSLSPYPKHYWGSH
jgi:hypothetical protein